MSCDEKLTEAVADDISPWFSGVRVEAKRLVDCDQVVVVFTCKHDGSETCRIRVYDGGIGPDGDGASLSFGMSVLHVFVKEGFIRRIMAIARLSGYDSVTNISAESVSSK
jgi:hypothetical protein